MDDSRIGEGAMLAAGALLSPGKAIPPGEIWVGRPAKFLRVQDEAQIAKIRFQTERYCRLARRHLAALRGPGDGPVNGTPKA
jgi:carbonic anhydrase/acetyltransferase-like protein (isoleucine patch superfamily)